MYQRAQLCVERLLTLLACLLCGLTLCAQNTNANDSTATELECPALIGGDDNLFIDKTTADYGRTFCLEYYKPYKVARWVAYQLHDGNSERNVERTDNFQPDTDIPYAYRAQNWMYDKTPFCRGHLCPSMARLCSEEQNAQTFLLSNIVPQYPKHNTSIWKRVENIIDRKLNTAAFRDTLYIVKGIDVITSTRVMLSYEDLFFPSYFYCAALCLKDGQYKALGILTPHENTRTWSPRWRNLLMSIDDLEEAVGQDFFCNLPDSIEDAIEATFEPEAWGLPLAE